MIRPARQDDLPQLLELGRRMHQESVYRDFEFCERRLTSYLAMVLDTPGRYCLHVAEREGRIVGFLAGYLEPFLFGRETVAHDTAFFVDRSQRGTTTAKRLIDAFRGWARERGARELCLGVSSGIEPERVGAFYERLGLSRAGAIYKQRLLPGSDDG
jgi:GNAT superfamily N-acetyltransferase